ncbi:MAG: IclR family transcriptional regulator, partial [Ktedonobacteraceae bacterium]
GSTNRNSRARIFAVPVSGTSDLTNALILRIIVLMTEQIVHFSEISNMETGANSTQLTPAPMVERAFKLLDLLSEVEEGMTLSDMARMLGMSKGSLHGLLKTLEKIGAIEQTEDKAYIPGPHIYELAQSYVQRAGLRRFALPAMQRLAAQIGKTMLLGRVEQNGVRIIERVEAGSEHAILHISAPRGTRVHLLAGATGRLVLASWPREQRETFLRSRPLPRFTEHAITDPEQFLAAVEKAARTGIGTDHEEYLVGVHAVAAPITGPGGILLALLWTIGFATHFDDEAMSRAGQLLHAEAQSISQLLGGK